MKYLFTYILSLLFIGAYSQGKKTIKKLGEIYTAPGYCTEVLYIYSAMQLIPGNHNREEGELGMEIMELSIEEIEKLISSGEITDAKTIVGIHYLKNRENQR